MEESNIIYSLLGPEGIFSYITLLFVLVGFIIFIAQSFKLSKIDGLVGNKLFFLSLIIYIVLITTSVTFEAISESDSVYLIISTLDSISNMVFLVLILSFKSIVESVAKLNLTSQGSNTPSAQD